MTLNQGEHVDELILAELDGALSAVERKTIESHVMRCDRCAATRMEQRSMQNTLAGPPVSSMDLTRGHDLIWRRIAEPRLAEATGFWRTAWTAVTLAATIALVVGVALTFIVTHGAARPDSSAAVIAQQDLALGAGVGMVTVTERLGPAVARQVVVTSDLRFAPAPGSGVLQIRLQRTGETYGILAAVPSLAGVTSTRIEGIVPPPASASDHYDVWVHVEIDGRVYDGAPISLRITSDRSGTHARRD